MTVVGVTMVRDEADIIETAVRHHLAEGCDRVIVADNLSTDGTRTILDRLAETLPVTVVDDPEKGYYQARKMTRLARQALEAGADWVVPFDADEFFYSDSGRLADVLEAAPPEMGVLVCEGWDHVGEGLSPWRRRDPQQFPKVVFRADPNAELAMGNHSVAHPGQVGSGPVRYRHHQYRSLDQMARKVRQGADAYAASDLPESEGAHWREAARLSDIELQARWLMLTSESGLVFDPTPIRRDPSVDVIVPTLDPDSPMVAACVESAGVPVRVVHDEHREGFGATCNRAAKDSAADIVVFLNDDTICQPGWLDALTRRIDWGVVGGLLTYPDGRVQHSGVFLRRDPLRRLEAFNRLSVPTGPGEVPAVTGACLAVSRGLWDELGGFDPGYVNGYEDIDFCLRARAAGRRVFLADDCRVTHFESQSTGRFDHANENIALLDERWGHLEV